MADIVSKKERSRVMSLIKGKWTKQEKAFHNFLKARKIKHKMHPKIRGSPDIIILEKKIAIFLHGCFWHGCKKCYKAPESHRNFWRNKLMHNISKDKKDTAKLKKDGWKVMIIWEHQIPRHNPGKGIRPIIIKMFR